MVHVPVVVVIAVLAAVVRAQVEVEFSGNVTLSSSQAGAFDFRVVDFVSFSESVLDVSVTGFVGAAAEIDGTATSNSGSATVDLVAGGFVAVTGSYPLSLALYFDDSTSWTSSSASSMYENIIANSKASGGLGVIVYLTIEEIDTSGSVVATVDLSTVFASDTTVGSSSSHFTDSTGNLLYNWVAGTHNSATYNFTYIQSQVVGQLSLGATMTPKSTDVMLQISGYTYASSGNHLRLTYLSAWGALNWDGTTTLSDPKLISTGTSANSVYIYNSDQVSISGNLQSGVTVTVTSQTEAEISSSNSDAYTLVDTFTGVVTFDNIGYAIVNIDFPAGATDIAYDPSLGFQPPSTTGSTSGDGSSDAATIRASLFAIVFAAFVAAVFNRL